MQHYVSTAETESYIKFSYMRFSDIIASFTGTLIRVSPIHLGLLINLQADLYGRGGQPQNSQVINPL